MPDIAPTTTSDDRSLFIPYAAIWWLVAAALVFIVGLQTVSLRDEERFVNDITLEANTSSSAVFDLRKNLATSIIQLNPVIHTMSGFYDRAVPRIVRLDVVTGTFEYQVVPEVQETLSAGTFVPGDDHVLLDKLVEDFPEEIEQITVGTDQIQVVYIGETEVNRAQGRIGRSINTVLRNEPETITQSASDNVLTYTTTDPQLVYGRFIPALLPEDESEFYGNRVAGEEGSELAQLIYGESRAVNVVAVEREALTISYRATAQLDPVIDRITDAMNVYYQRASLGINLSTLRVASSSGTILQINPVSTAIPLYVVAIFFALVELFLAFYYRDRDSKLVRPLVRVFTVFLFFWSVFGHEPLWDYVLGQLFPDSRQLVHPNATVIEFVAQHLELVIVSSLVTIPGGLLLGIIVTRENFREILPLVNNLVNSGQTVPTIAIVAIMAPIIGFGFWPAIVALIAYGLLPVVRNTIAGLEAVDGSVIDSARGMGMTPRQILFQIELPIASSIIMAGVRTSMVVNVGTATLGAFVGSGGLGTPIASGLGMSIDPFVVLGAIPAAILAILVDYILGRIEYVITPKGLQIE